MLRSFNVVQKLFHRVVLRKKKFKVSNPLKWTCAWRLKPLPFYHCLYDDEPRHPVLTRPFWIWEIDTHDVVASMWIYSILPCRKAYYRRWQNVFLIAVLVVKGHHLSLAIGNLTRSGIRRTECSRKFVVPGVLLCANRSTWFATVSGPRGAGEGYLTKFNTSRLRAEVQPLNLLYTFRQKRYPFYTPFN